MDRDGGVERQSVGRSASATVVDPVEEGLDLAGAGIGPRVGEGRGLAERPLRLVEPPAGVVLGLGVAAEGLDGPLEEPGEAVEAVGLGGRQAAGLAAPGERAGRGARGLSQLGGGEAEPVGEAVGSGEGEAAFDAGDGVGGRGGAEAEGPAVGDRAHGARWQA